MNTSVLVLVTLDPRTSPKPAEAVRIAAGIGAWKRVQVILYFRGPAVLVLGEHTDALIDGAAFGRYLPLLRDLGRPIYVQAGSRSLKDIDTSEFRTAEISDPQLAGLISENQYLLRF